MSTISEIAKCNFIAKSKIYTIKKNNVKIRLKSKLNFLKKDNYYALCNRLSSAG